VREKTGKMQKVEVNGEEVQLFRNLLENEQLLLCGGIESIDEDTSEPSQENRCWLLKLTFPTKDGGSFSLTKVHAFTDKNYKANTWLTRLGTNSRYVFGPTSFGHIVVWNILTRQVTAHISDHSEVVRDVIFHKTEPLMITCGDDSQVIVYRQLIAESSAESLSESVSESDSKLTADTKIEVNG